MKRIAVAHAAIGAALVLVLATAGATSLSCAGGLHNPTLVDSVRILAGRADPQAFAVPGSVVSLTVLAVDGRPAAAAPMTVYWIPVVCENPKDDAYYACFSQISGAVGAGAAALDGGEGGAGAAGPLPTGVDLTPYLPTGPTFQFTMPVDAVDSHPPTATPNQYGLAIVFNVACAGHVELVAQDPNNVQSPPIGCFDVAHNRLGPNDYVIGIMRVYAYKTISNNNPQIDSINTDGDFDAGLTVSACTQGPCPKVRIGPVVPASSQEPNPQQLNRSGGTLNEQLWAAYFSTVGSFTNEAKLLYDPAGGLVGSARDTDNEFQPPDTPGDGGGTMWIVVHDDRGGAAWQEIPLHVK